MTRDPAATDGSAASIGSNDLAAPLYIAWQLTNECNLACLHCIEESGPGKAFPDEMNAAAIFNILDQLSAEEVPYLSLSGGEPMLHPLFFDMVDRICSAGAQLKIETNGHYLDAGNCDRLHELGVKAVQVSLDGATSQTFNRMRIRGDFDRVVEGLQRLQKADVPIEINFSPTCFNVQEVAATVDLAYELGACSFYSGRTMFTGNAVKTWKKLSPTEDQYVAFFDALHEKAEEYRGRMRVHFHEPGLVEELRYRLKHPAALLIVLPNGLVKLINALPFICGDLRKQSLIEVWANFKRAWADPQVSRFVDALAADPTKTSTLHKWVYL